ncbi:MAG: hypothetical protein HOL58_02560 [Francisellaceae bacterium]|jgi:hypothetical protein|nr:hypothetical protein [Francisellaceae bacterium]
MLLFSWFNHKTPAEELEAEQEEELQQKNMPRKNLVLKLLWVIELQHFCLEAQMYILSITHQLNTMLRSKI